MVWMLNSRQHNYSAHSTPAYFGGVNQTMSKHPTETSQQTNADVSRDHSDEPSLLRLLRKSGEHGLIDGELRQELERLFELLYRIDQLIERTEQFVTPTAREQIDEADEKIQSESDPADQQAGNDEFHIGGHIVAFDPAEFTRPPLAASPLRRPATEPVTESHLPRASGGDTHSTHTKSGSWAASDIQESRQQPNRPGVYQCFQDAGDEQLERWWVNFNGDVSLERLARLRQVLGESPFTIETRFEEISEGLIILRVVTDRTLTEAHVDWIVRQVMGSVGLNRDAAILSSLKEKSGGHRWASTAIS